MQRYIFIVLLAVTVTARAEPAPKTCRVTYTPALEHEIIAPAVERAVGPRLADVDFTRPIVLHAGNVAIIKFGSSKPPTHSALDFTGRFDMVVVRLNACTLEVLEVYTANLKV